VKREPRWIDYECPYCQTRESLAWEPTTLPVEAFPIFAASIPAFVCEGCKRVVRRVDAACLRERSKGDVNQ